MASVPLVLFMHLFEFCEVVRKHNVIALKILANHCYTQDVKIFKTNQHFVTTEKPIFRAFANQSTSSG